MKIKTGGDMMNTTAAIMEIHGRIMTSQTASVMIHVAKTVTEIMETGDTAGNISHP